MPADVENSIMYKEYWGLAEYPFDNLPNPVYLYKSPLHEEALTRLLYAIENCKGAAMLTGEIGCGKTTISRLLVQRLVTRDYRLALIENPSIEPEEFFREILYQFGVETPADSKREMINHLNDYLYGNLKAGKKSVIIVDEAQIIENERTFEELRLLLNFQLNDRFLLSLILIGQPELREKISKIPQLDQRIAIRYHLIPLDIDEMVRFIFFRLRKAGARQNMFSDDAFRKIYEYSSGIPRMVNNICDLSLLIGCGESANLINPGIVDKSAHSFC
jgi:general secretion pathway protein A